MNVLDIFNPSSTHLFTTAMVSFEQLYFRNYQLYNNKKILA